VREIPTEVPLSRADGMPRDCAVNLDHVQTVARERLGAVITQLDRERMEQVRGALLFALAM
jgi:mRNA interferase MazF